MFYLLLTTQIVFIALLILSVRISRKNPTAFFSPVSWFILFYLLVFLIPQFYMPKLNYPLIWTNKTVLFGQIDKVVLTQKTLCAFLIAFSAGYFVFFPKKARPRPLKPLNRSERVSGLVFGIIGIVATIGIILGLNPDSPRSAIVASTLGKILYALSYFMTLGFLIFCAVNIKRKKYVIALTSALIFSFLLFQLGGRGRVLWPFVSLFAWASIYGVVKLNLVKMSVVAILLAVVLQGMDPLLLYMKNKRSETEAWEEFSAGLTVDNFFFGRTFDAFHNLSVVVNEDKIEPSWSYLFSGSQRAFMHQYFPEVARGGVGFPATMPGGLWISGRFEGVVLGGLLFGLLFGWLSLLYRKKMNREIDLIVFVMAMPVVANIGTSWLDSYLKMLALILPGIFLIVRTRLEK